MEDENACVYCHETLVGSLAVLCIECEDIQLCLTCYSHGAQIGPHKNNHAYKLKFIQVVVENLLSKVSEHQEKLRVQQDITTEKKKSRLQIFKTQIFDLLENDVQCPICSEILLKPVTANCNHTFCEGCITRWLNENISCPVCRSNIQKTNYCLVMDNFITNLCDLLGGTAKLQRDNLKKERTHQ